MQHIVCLIQPVAQSHALSDDLLRTVSELAGCDPRWLSAERAVEFATDREPGELRAAVRALLRDLPVDFGILPAEGRRKSVFLSDMDSTMITAECIDELADELSLKEQVAAITRRAMNGEIAFAHALAQRVELLAGLEEAVIARICHDRLNPAPGAATLLATLRAQGVRTVLVSGGFKPFTGFVRRELGFDDDEANALEIVEGRLTGRLVPPIKDASAKLARLQAEAVKSGSGLQDTVAVGDGANDLPMVCAAGLGVIYRGHARVREEAAKAGAVLLDHTDLSSILFLMGCRQDEIIERPDRFASSGLSS